MQERLETRAKLAGVELPAALAAPLLAYFALLERWNRKINLTALSDVDLAIDRLLLEPVAAAPHLPHGGRLMDLGSGGGSPAIPLALASAASELVMVESRSRKAAFLREAARELGLKATVEAARFEDVAGLPRYREAMDVVSIRAVRMDAATLSVAKQFLLPQGVLALFSSASSPISAPAALSGAKPIRLVGSAELVVCTSG